MTKLEERTALAHVLPLWHPIPPERKPLTSFVGEIVEYVRDFAARIVENEQTIYMLAEYEQDIPEQGNHLKMGCGVRQI